MTLVRIILDKNKDHQGHYPGLLMLKPTAPNTDLVLPTERGLVLKMIWK
jgi:hypothetical protein